MENPETRSMLKKLRATDSWIPSTNQHLLVFHPEAARKLLAFIGWGRNDYPINRVEQGGWLLGKYKTGSNGIVVAEVLDIMPAKAEKATTAYWEISNQEEYHLCCALDDLRADIKRLDPVAAESLKRVGWFHTHVLGTPVFMSGTDMGTQHRRFFHDTDFSVVLNPHQLVYKAFRGKDAIETAAILQTGAVSQNVPAKKKQKQGWKKRKRQVKLAHDKKKRKK